MMHLISDNTRKKLTVAAAVVTALILPLTGCGRHYRPIETAPETSASGAGEQTEAGLTIEGQTDASVAESGSAQTGADQTLDAQSTAAETTQEETQAPLVYDDPPQLDSGFHRATKKEWNSGWYRNEKAGDDVSRQWRYINELGEAASGGWEWIDTDGDQTAECFYFSDDGYLVRNEKIDGYTLGTDGRWMKGDEAQTLDISTLNGWTRLNAMDGYFLNGWKYRNLITPDNVYVDSRGAAVKKSDIDAAAMAAESADAMIVAVSKKTHFLEVWQGGAKIRSYVITSGSADGDKVQQGDRKTPEGTFYVCQKNPNSEYTRGLILNYPTNEDAERGLAAGLINQTEYDGIIRDNGSGDTPSFDTALGGDIEIHGARDSENNSAGCIELLDDEMVELYDMVELGTKVYVLP